MLRRIIIPLVAFAVLLSSFTLGAGQAHAQRDTTAIPGVWKSSILIRNLSSLAAADVRIQFYKPDGTLTLTYPDTSAQAMSLSANGSVSVFTASLSSLLPGQYSAVVSSNQKVAVTVQGYTLDQPASPWISFGYDGIDATNAAQTLFFPVISKNFYNFYSEMVIQNTSETTATSLTANFYRQDGTKINATPISLGPLPAHSAKTFASTDAVLSSLPSGNSLATGGLFGAVITSSATNIAGIANSWSTYQTTKVSSYNAFSQGSRTIYAPILDNNFYFYVSTLTLQNVDPTNTATGTITYSNGTSEPFTIAPYAVGSFRQFKRTDITLPTGNTDGSFSAKVEVTSTGGSVIGVVGFSRPQDIAGGIYGDAAEYNCPSTPSAGVAVAGLTNNYYGMFTTVSVQNVGAPAYITLTYASQGGVVKKWTTKNLIPTNGIANFTHLAKIVDNPLGSTPMITSAIASSSDINGQPLSSPSPVLVIVNQNTEASVLGYAGKLPADYLQVSSGFPMP